MKSGGEIKFNGTMLTDQSIIRALWILTAIGAPIFGVSFWHLKIGPMHLAPSVIFMGLILYVVALRFFLGFGVIPKGVSLNSYKTLAFLLAAFVVIHALSWMHAALGQSDWLNVLGTKNMVKLFFGVILFWLTLIFFPRDEKFIGRFFLISGTMLACLLAVFIHRYAAVFHMPFLSTDYYGYAKTGKNQVAVQAVFFFFYMLSFFFLSKKRWFILPFLLIIVASILYLQSRMGWAAALFGLIYLIGYVWRRNPKMGRGLFFKSLLIVLTTGALSLALISRYVDLTTMFLRFLTIFNPGIVPDDLANSLGQRSYQVRGETIMGALNGFLASPIIGTGIGNTFNYVERLTHNDHITLLVEMGSLGEFLFLLILWNIWRRESSSTSRDPQSINWLSMAARAGFVTLFICINFFNMYLSPYFWIYLALYIVTVETTNKNREVAWKRM